MMNMKKLLALLLAVVMVLGMIPFGAMAEEAEPVTHIETCLEGCALEDCACTCHAAPETPAEEPKQEQPPVAPASLDDTQTQETPICTCTPVEGVHAEGCALYVKPEAPVVPEEEVLSVDYAALYESIMNCDDLFAADVLVDALTEEQQAAFEATLTEEQKTALVAHMDALYDAANMEETTGPASEEEFVEHVPEIVTPSRDMTNAAPFLAPAEGPVMRMMRMLKAVPVAEEEDNGLILNKTVSEPDKDGIYTLTLEAYATGEKTTIKQEEDIPTDIILVLDQSGSMDEGFTSVVYNQYNGTLGQLYNNRNNLYVKLEDGSYSKVTVNRANTGTGEYTYQQYSTSNNQYYSNSGKFYHKCSNGTYGLVTVRRVNEGWLYPDYVYTYTCANGCTLGTSSNSQTPSFRNTFYQRTESTKYQYTFTYTKSDGTNETVRVMEDEAVPSLNFYLSQAGGSTTRLAALKTAVRNFADAVATKAKGADGISNTGDEVDHTISVVGFASGKTYNWVDYNYGNTELFVGGTTYRYNAGSANNASNASAAQRHYEDAPQDMSTAEGVANVTASITALDADGGTIINLGMEMANGILEANPVPSGEKRNRVVIVFTDGIPGWSGYDSDVANAALAQANIAKNTHKATVYTVGIFEGADATSAGSNGNNASESNRANYFMQRLSSNTSYPQTPSYYLSASDSNALNNIFQTISEEIENGGSSIELDGDTVVKDIIADSFKLPDGADTNSIQVYTDSVDPATGHFKDTPEAFNATVTISGKDISVTDFNFKENWVGAEKDVNGNPTYRGKKLIIEIPIVPNPDFLGGNNVPTNGSASGVYNNGELVENFPGPDTDVALKILEIGLATTDQNIYLSNDADLAALVTSLDQRINGTNNAYVDVKYEIKDGETVIGTVTIPAGSALPSEIVWTEAADQDMTPNLDAVDTKNYTIVATATPTSSGSYGPTTNTKTEPVNVFKPVITWKDSQINGGQTPDYEGRVADVDDNLVSVIWKHGETLSTEKDKDGKSIMSGTEPVLSYTFDPDAQPMSVDTHVDVTVLVGTGEEKTDITRYVTFVHEDCNFNGCKWEEAKKAGKEFIVHIKSFDLIIKKQGVNVNLDGNAPFVFNVSGKGVDMNVVIYGNGSATIKGLPSGTYTVEEISGYWRYEIDAEKSAKEQEVTANGPTATVTFFNKRTENKWLDDWAKATNKFNGSAAVFDSGIKD